MQIYQMMGKVGKLLMAVFILLGSSAYAQVVRVPNYMKNNSDGSQTLLNHVPKAVTMSSTSLVSHASSTQMLDLRIMLPSKDPAGLDNFIKDIYNRKSPNYHKFLTPQQFAQQFGASTVDSSIILDQLKSQGLTVKSQSKSGLMLTVTGPVSTVESFFKVKINNYRKADKTMFFAPDSNPTIPLKIAGKVYAIIGLDNVHRFHPHYYLKNLRPVVKPAPAAVSLASHAMSAPAAAAPAFTGFGGALGPNDIKTAYNLNSVASTGSGQTLALYELDGYVTSDVTTFETFYGLPHTTLTNVYTDGATGAAGSNTDEVVLDTDLAIGVAPGLSNILLYEAPNTAPGWIDQWDRIASDDVAKVISCSWGLNEADSYPFYDHTVFAQLAAQGQTVFVSSGDAGAYDNCDGGTLPPSCFINGSPGVGIVSVDDPASDPYVTGVGISVLTANGNGTYNSETASLYGGGGISSYWSIPTFQQGLTLASGSLVSTTMRNVPDLSFTADPATLYAIYVSDQAPAGWYGFWGSSAASPIWAAFLTRVNQGRAASGQDVVGYLNPVMYQFAQGSNYTTDFHDITTGNNSFYPGKVGYDDATGLGSFNGANLYTDLLGPAAPAGLIATPGNTQVALSWTAASGAVSYNVKRALVNGGPYTTISVGGAVTGTSYTDTGLTNGVTYYYVVSTVNSIWEGANSSQVSGIPLVAPLAPTGLTATSGNAQAGLSWTASATAASYNVKRSAVNGGPYVTVSSSGTVTGTSYTDTGLTNGLTYYYVVSAVNGAGESPNSAQASVVPVVPPLASPTNLNVTLLGARVGNRIIYGGITMTWTQSVSPAILHEKIYRAIGAGSYSLVATLPASTSYTDTSLVKGTAYKYEVTAVNSNGESAPSNVGTINF